jgi:E3 ubiquitin-protein ligase RNF5
MNEQNNLHSPQRGGNIMATNGLIQSAPIHHSGSQDNNDNDLSFTCNICLEGVKDKDPVVTQCGHLYCWPCLYRWLHTRHSDSTCPVCKAGVTQENVIPIFIRGSKADPRNRPTADAEEEMNSSSSIPNRPQGHRPLPPVLDMGNPNTAGNQFQFNGQFQGISFSTSFGFFPSLFGLQFQSFAPILPETAENLSTAEEEQQQLYLSRVLLLLGIAVICCLLFF